MGAEFASCVESSGLSFTHGGCGEHVSEGSISNIMTIRVAISKQEESSMLDAKTYRFMLGPGDSWKRVLQNGDGTPIYMPS